MQIAFFSSGTFRQQKEATIISLLSMAKEMIHQGHSVVIIARNDSNLPFYEKMGEVPIYRVKGGKLLLMIRQAVTLARIQKKLGRQFDIMHTFSAAPLFALQLIIAKHYAKKAKAVHTLKSYSKYIFGRYFVRILNSVDLITVPTSVFKQKIIDLGVNQNKIRVVRSQIDTSKFHPMTRQLLKNKYGYKHKNIIFYYGSLYTKKGVNVLLQALPRIINKYPNTEVIIAPRHKVPQEYANLIASSPARNSINVKEDINVVEYVNMADVVVLPYIDLIATEGNPSCLLESIACKTPVVTTDLPELREIVQHGKDVLMAKPGDVDDLANNIILILKNRALARRLANNAFKKIKEFDVGVVTKKFLELYKELLH